MKKNKKAKGIKTVQCAICKKIVTKRSTIQVARGEGYVRICKKHDTDGKIQRARHHADVKKADFAKYTGEITRARMEFAENYADGVGRMG